MTNNQIIAASFLAGNSAKRLAKNWNMTVELIQDIIRKNTRSRRDDRPEKTHFNRGYGFENRS